MGLAAKADRDVELAVAGHVLPLQLDSEAVSGDAPVGEDLGIEVIAKPACLVCE